MRLCQNRPHQTEASGRKLQGGMAKRGHEHGRLYVEACYRMGKAA